MEDVVYPGAAGIAGSSYSLVDLNRAGTPLLEIVSEPDMRSSDEARAYMEELRKKYEVVIGLEVHAQLKTKSKIFACDSTEFGNEQNTQVSPITLGMPGVLPVLNKEVVNMGFLTGLALNCTIPQYCKFDRKHYFYPDLPKGYQICKTQEFHNSKPNLLKSPY